MANLKLIKEISYKKGMLLHDLSDRADVPYHTIQRMMLTGNGSIGDLERIADVLQVAPLLFFLSERYLE